MATRRRCSFPSAKLVAVLLVALFVQGGFAQNCGPLAGNRLCQPGYCCDKSGFCGNTNSYCGEDCKSQCPAPQIFTQSLAASTCLQKNGIKVGWLPDQDTGVQMTAITNVLGQNACYYGLYSQIESQSWNDASGNANQLTGRMSDIKASGAILQAAVMPTKVRFADIGTTLASRIATVMKQFTDNGITVWLRFAHEVNYYVQDKSCGSNCNTYVGGTPAEFIQAWKNVANAVKGNPNVKMFWSPNVETGDGKTPIAPWWPGSDYVDIVGMDVYHNTAGSVPSFADTYGSFISKYSTPYNKPFAIAETGTTAEGNKKAWLTDISSASSKSQYPTYNGFAWFEYLKDKADFRVVTGTTDYAKSVLL